MGERVWGSSSLETGSSHHKIWNNPSFSIKIVISASFSSLRLFSFFGAICWRSFDQSKVSIYQCPKKQKPQFTLTNIINLIKFKWKLETGNWKNRTTIAVTHKANYRYEYGFRLRLRFRWRFIFILVFGLEEVRKLTFL